MSAPINITVEADLDKLAEALRRFPVRLLTEVRASMDTANQFVLHATRKTRFTGKGPFPPAQHRLGIKSSQLRKSLYATKARITGDTVESSIGSPLKYFGVHEFGHQGPVNIRAHLNRDFMGTGREVKIPAHVRNVRIPERAPLRHGIEEHAHHYSTELVKAIDRALTPPAA